MSDETTTLEQPAETPVEPTTPGAADPQIVDAPAETPIDLEEIEFDGEKYSVPKKLKDGFLMQSDYTRKTQDVATQRKALETAQEAVRQEREAQAAHTKDVGRVLMLNDRLAEFDKVDWQRLGNEDPFKAQQLFTERTLLKDQRDGLIAQIQNAEQERSQKSQQDFAKRYAETNETLAKEVQGWGQDLANKLTEFAKSSGMTEADIRQAAVSVPMVKLLHKAYLGEQLIKERQAAAQAADPKVEPIPLRKVSGSGAKGPANLFNADMETYVAERKKQGFGTR